MKWNPTNLQILRERAGVSQIELAAFMFETRNVTAEIFSTMIAMTA